MESTLAGIIVIFRNSIKVHGARDSIITPGVSVYNSLTAKVGNSE